MTAFDLQLNPSNPGMQFHRVDGARDKNFWSVRVNRDIRLIDEAQDIAVPELRFLAARGGYRPNALFFAGDLGQRIFQTPFSWKAMGESGAPGRARTYDPLIKSQLLCQLSYGRNR